MADISLRNTPKMLYIEDSTVTPTQKHPEQNNNPTRYDGDKCMQFIEEFPLKEAQGNSSGAMFCIGSIIKYLWRLERKGHPLDQLDKVDWYLARLRSYYAKKEN